MIVSYTYTTELVSGDLSFELTISGTVKNTYRIVGKFAGGEVWWIMRDLSN